MAFDLYLKFSGLCAFAPGINPDTVVLTDSRNFSMPHIAAIVIPLVNLLNTPRIDGFLIVNDNHYEALTMIAFPLENEELSISPTGMLAVPGAMNPPGAGQPCPDPNKDAHYFGWTASMSDFGAGTMLREAYSGALTSGLALARFKLPPGCSAYNDVPALLNDQSAIVRWSFPPSNVLPRALAEVVTVHREMPTYPPSPLGKDTMMINSSRASRSFVITGAGGGSASIWIVNMPKPDIIQNRTQPSHQRSPDNHFSEFFRLAVGTPPAVTPTPVAGLDCGPFSWGQALTPKCPPAFFDDVEQ